VQLKVIWLVKLNMARQKRLNLPGAVYHIITRGLNGSAIFKDKADRDELLLRLAKSLDKSGF
jgi:hypothetical protein